MSEKQEIKMSHIAKTILCGFLSGVLFTTAAATTGTVISTLPGPLFWLAIAFPMLGLTISQYLQVASHKNKQEIKDE